LRNDGACGRRSRRLHDEESATKGQGNHEGDKEEQKRRRRAARARLYASERETRRLVGFNPVEDGCTHDEFRN
jgi:hypothetical protein